MLLLGLAVIGPSWAEGADGVAFPEPSFNPISGIKMAVYERGDGFPGGPFHGGINCQHWPRRATTRALWVSHDAARIGD